MNNWEPQLDYSSKDWKTEYANLKAFDMYEARAIDLYNYSKMLVDTARKCNLIDWYDHCNEQSTWNDIPDIYLPEDLPMIYDRFNTMYQNAKKGIVSLNMKYINQLRELALKGMIADINIIENSSERGCTFTVVESNEEI